MDPLDSCFFVMCSGQVSIGDFNGKERLYVKYDYTYGKDWMVVRGVDRGVSQVAHKGEGSTKVVWNFPLDVVFRGTSVHGWPRIVVSVFGIDMFGRDTPVGYGTTVLPLSTGQSKRTVPMFKPVLQTWVQQLTSWVRGTQPEYYDSRFVGKATGREVTRVSSEGIVILDLNIMTRGLEKHGYAATRQQGERLAKKAIEEAENNNPAVGGNGGAPRASSPSRKKTDLNSSLDLLRSKLGRKWRSEA